MLIADIVRRVRDSAGDTAVLQFTNETLTDWINDGIRECVTENSLLQNRANSNTVIGQADYSLPTDIFKIHSVIVDGLKLEVLTLEQYEERNAGEPVGTTATDSNPFLCYIYAGILTLWPTPNSVKAMSINYTKMPITIEYDGTSWTPNIPSIHEAFHSRIVSYCLAQVALQDEDHYRYQMLMQEFHTGVKGLKDIKDTEDDLYPFISVSSRDMGETWASNHTIF